MIIFMTVQFANYKLQVNVQRMKGELTSRSFQGLISYRKVPRLRVSRVEKR